MAKVVKVNKDVCISCGLCTSVCSDVFYFGDDGKAEVSLEGGIVPSDLEGPVDEAKNSCPVQAIEVEE